MTTKVTIKNENVGETGNKVSVYFINPLVEGMAYKPVLVVALLPEQSQEFYLHEGQRLVLDESE